MLQTICTASVLVKFGDKNPTNISFTKSHMTKLLFYIFCTYETINNGL